VAVKPIGHYAFNAVASGGSNVVVVGDGNHSAVATVANVATSSWTASTVVSSGSPNFSGVAYRSSDGLFIAAGNSGVPPITGVVAAISDAALTTSNVSIWTSAAPSEEVGLNSVGLASDGVYFGGNAGVILRSINLTSSSGTFARANPQPAAAVPLTTTFNSIRAIGSKLFAVGTGGVILSSSDGQTFSTATSGTTNPLYSVMKQGSTFYAVGNAGTIVTSGDGATWTPIFSSLSTSNSSSNLRFIDYLNGQFVASGNGGLVLTSPTGATSTWTSTALAGASGGTIYGVAYGNNTYVAVGGNDGFGAGGINYV